MNTEGASMGTEGATKGKRTREEIIAERIARAVRPRVGVYATLEEANAGLAARRTSLRVEQISQCPKESKAACPFRCTWSCLAHMADRAEREKRAAAKRDRLMKRNGAIAASMERAAPEKRRIPAPAMVKAKGKPPAPKSAAEKGIRAATVEMSVMVKGSPTVQRASVKYRGDPVEVLGARLKLQSWQKAAAEDLLADLAIAEGALRSQEVKERVDGGMASPSFDGFLDAQRRIGEAARWLGRDEFEFVLLVLLNRLSASRIHAAGGAQHILVGERLRMNLDRLADFYQPGSRRPDKTLVAIRKIMAAAGEDRISEANAMIQTTLKWADA